LNQMIYNDMAGAPVDTMEEWKQMQLIEGEEVVMKPLEVVGFQGMPSVGPDEIKVGNGMLMITKFPATGKHRVHFVIKNMMAEFKGEETWDKTTFKSTSVLSGSEGMSSNVKADYQAVHKEELLCSVLNLEGNLFHADTTREDSATLGAKILTRKAAYEAWKCPCPNPCKGCKLPKCPKCPCPKCPLLALCPCFKPCFGSTSMTNDQGHWKAATSFKESFKMSTEQLLEEGNFDRTLKFPGMEFQKHKEDLAVVGRQIHCIHLIFRNTADNMVQSAIVVARPTEKFANLAKSASYLSSLVVDFPLSKEISRDDWHIANLITDGAKKSAYKFAATSSTSAVSKSKKSMVDIVPCRFFCGFFPCRIVRAILAPFCPRRVCGGGKKGK